MRRTAGILALCGTAAVLLAAPTAHALEPASATVLAAAPAAATAGEVVRFTAPVGAADYAWDFDGDGTWDVEGPKAERDHRYAEAGAYSVTVRLTAPDGTESVQKLALDVDPSVVAQDVDAIVDDTPDDEPALPGDDDGGDDADDPDAAAGATGDDEAEPGASSLTPRKSRQTVTAQTAATKSVTITDFEFTPATITVNAGDTVQWKNDGPTVHTATADDDSFDTGNLAEGESGSATFDTEGSFSYICTPHPFMKGTVEVVAAGADTGTDDDSSDSGGSSGDTSGSTTSDDSGTSGSSGSGSDSSLPTTGTTDLRIVGLIGFALLLGGFGLRRFARWV